MCNGWTVCKCYYLLQFGSDTHFSRYELYPQYLGIVVDILWSNECLRVVRVAHPDAVASRCYNNCWNTMNISLVCDAASYDKPPKGWYAEKRRSIVWLLLLKGFRLLTFLQWTAVFRLTGWVFLTSWYTPPARNFVPNLGSCLNPAAPNLCFTLGLFMTVLYCRS